MVWNDFSIDAQRTNDVQSDICMTRDIIEEDEDLTDKDFPICPSSVQGYIMRRWKWCLLDVNIVHDIQDRGDGFESLVLPDGHKETLLALVQQSEGKYIEQEPSADPPQMDLIRGKGKGLIILLHGEPGAGKTSTAEFVAEYTRRPLLMVTCGDIGHSAGRVEERLEDHFQLAHRWGCVLLLDEADVFLQKRSQEDLKRNAVVSVFLKVLEYYSGILFLTTNRVGAFDQAFHSRIHMSLYYPRLNESFTKKVWRMNFAHARKTWGDKVTVEEDDVTEILDYASEHYRDLQKTDTTWNGQIRNAFQTAIVLAEWDAHKDQEKYKLDHSLKPALKKNHFFRVAKASQHFDAYLKETVSATAADLAMENHERRDNFKATIS